MSLNESYLRNKAGAGGAAGQADPSCTGGASRPGGVKAALAALRVYKVYVSPWLAGSCRFEPTCSVYAYEAIERFGVLRGTWLGLKRLARCQPLSRKFGYDPVPGETEKEERDCRAATQDPGRGNRMPKEAHS